LQAALMVSLHGKNSTNMHPLASRKIVPMILQAQGIVFGFSMGDSVMLFHALLFHFWIKVMKPTFITHNNALKKVVAFENIMFQQM
jgi:hypothetical protein